MKAGNVANAGADVAGADVAGAEALLVRARALGDSGRPAEALDLCDEALRMIPVESERQVAAPLRCRILITAAYQYSGLGDIVRALAVLEDADRSDPAQRAEVSQTRAMCLMRAGDTQAAMASFDEAIAGLQGGDPRVLAAALLNRGALHMNEGRLGPAQADTEAAHRAAQARHDPWGVFMAAHNLGYIRFLSGDLPGALASMDAAQAAVDEPPVGMPAMDRARVLLAAGLIREAADFSQLAVADFDRNRAVSELPDALVVAAETDLLQGDFAAALAKAQRAKALNRDRGNTNAALLDELIELKAAAAGRRSPAQSRSDESGSSTARARSDALRAAEVAKALTDDLPGDAIEAYLVAAEALLEVDDLDGAAAMADLAAGLSRRPPMATRLHTRLVAARLELRRDRRSSGLAHIRHGLDDLADFQARFGSQDMQSGAAVHGAELARLGLRTAVAGRSPATILQWLERSRAVSTRLPAVHPPADQELAEALGRLRLATVEARAAAVAGHRDPDLDRLVAELRRRIRARSWTVSGSGTVKRPLSLAAVQRLLAGDPSDPSVLALVHGAQELHLLLITARRATHHQLVGWPVVDTSIRRAAGDLDVLATPRIPAPVRIVAQHSLAGSLAALDRDLLAPVREKLTAGPVIVVAVGQLATLPWGLLPSLAGRPVSVDSSVTAAMSAVGRPSRAYLRGVLAVAGPDVPGGAEEVMTVAGLHPDAGLLVGADASGEAVLSQLPQGGLLHIAAHGRHEPESPLFSSVQLADGPLYGYDIAPSPALPDHVVLSSCDVGRNHERPGGEPLGLAAALLRSGVSTVVAGVSRISDRVAAQTMVVYHQRLLAGDGPAVALAAAIATADGAPAPLTCFGAGS